MARAGANGGLRNTQFPARFPGQQVIGARYLVSYRPSAFQNNGAHRAIDVQAEKDGHKRTIYARKGYYASRGAIRIH